MEVEHPTSDLPLPKSAPSSRSTSEPDPTALGVLDTVFSLEEFLANTPAPPPPAKKRPPPPKNPKTGPTVTTDENGNIVPTLISARSSKNTILLHEKYQFYALQPPEFVFEGGSDVGWSCKVRFLGEEIGMKDGAEGEKMFSSKQEAKEVLSGRALEVLAKQVEEGKVVKPKKEGGKKKKKVMHVEGGKEGDAEVEGEVETKVQEPFVNWTGLLLEFQRTTSSAQPTYTDYVLGTKFSCTLTFDGLDQTFGSTNELFSTKKAARQNAAKSAVDHFKSAGLWPETNGIDGVVGGIKKKKKTASTTPQMISTLSPSPSAEKDKENMPPNPSGQKADAGPTYASRAAALSQTLGFGTLEWRYTPEAVPNFHTVACYFPNCDPGEFPGPVGEVRHVYGRKKAKEECARFALEYLQGVQEQRREYTRRMLAGAGIVMEDKEKKVVEDPWAGAPLGMKPEAREKERLEARKAQEGMDKLDRELREWKRENGVVSSGSEDEDEEEMGRSQYSVDYDQFEDAVEEIIKGDV